MLLPGEHDQSFLPGKHHQIWSKNQTFYARYVLTSPDLLWVSKTWSPLSWFWLSGWSPDSFSSSANLAQNWPTSTSTCSRPTIEATTSSTASIPKTFLESWRSRTRSSGTWKSRSSRSLFGFKSLSEERAETAPGSGDAPDPLKRGTILEDDIC